MGRLFLLVAFATGFVGASASEADGQFRKYPRLGRESAPLAEAGEGTHTELLPTGNLSFDFDGGYDVSMNVLQLFITPDIDGWDWYIPIVLLTAPSENSGGAEGEVRGLTRSLSGEAQGVFNVTASYSREWRGMKTVTVQGVSEPVKSMTGLWLDAGAQAKGHLTTAVLDGETSTDLSSTLGAYAALQGQITVSEKNTLEDMDDLAGVIYGRAYLTYAAWLNRSGSLEALASGESPGGFLAFEGTVGVFLFDGGGFEASLSRTWGTDVEDLEETVLRAGLRLVPNRILKGDTGQ